MEETEFTEALLDYWEEQEEQHYQEQEVNQVVFPNESQEEYNERLNDYIESHIEDAWK